ncbi:unnamed protein product [Urochloa decumbens]|uniref:F-box protein AT5G49610-like beta-propeller domain-containing protein n=1 Tax=Urochloa decumbens TaxID=240449 RepID=A0ABC8VW35_9POAL
MEPPPPQKRRRTTAEEPTTIHDMPDDLLRQILLRLDSPLWLVRAACASKPLRRAIIAGGRAFLRHAASLHPPVVVGHYYERSMRPIAFVPSSSPAPPPVDAGRFALKFLPRDVTTTAYWEVSDCHAGLLLLRDGYNYPPNSIVCDPLTRRYQGIPHPPVENLKRVGHAFALLDGDDGDISISSFRVLYHFLEAPHVCVFFTTASGGAGGWRFLSEPADGGYKHMGHVAGRVDGSLYFGISTGNVKVLDNASWELSEVDLPIGIDTSKPPKRSAFTVVHGAGHGRTSPATTRIVHVHGEDLEVFRRRVSGDEWVLEHSIAKLSEATRGLFGYRPDKRLEWTEVRVISVGNGIAVLSARDRRTDKWLFSVDMDTEEMKVVPKEPYRGIRWTCTYTLPWRQFLRACPC